MNYFDMGTGVADLVERLLPTLEVRGSNPVIGKLYITYVLSNALKQMEMKKKRPRIAHFKPNKVK